MSTEPNDKTGGTPVHSSGLLAEVTGIAGRTAHEIMAQIKFGVPTEKLFALMVRNACIEAIVSANSNLSGGGDKH